MSDQVISKLDKNRIARLDKVDSAFLMLFLADRFHTEQTQAFSKELVLAICWEESFFQNISQFGGPAVGYGQLEMSGRSIANQHLTGNPGAGEGAFKREAILASRETSIRAVSHCLAGMYERLNNSQRGALNGYAGVIQRPANAPIPGKWLACADALREALARTATGTFNPIVFEDALRKAREFEREGPVYEHIHSRLWPLLDVIGRLVDQVQIGAQGEPVRVVQDVMNRLRMADPSSGQSLPPLVVDGLFGSRTHGRVKEFQARNRLSPDGVVGSRTRGTLRMKARTFSMA